MNLRFFYWLLATFVSTALCSSPAVLAAETLYKVKVVDQTWRDTQRERDLPLKLRIPQKRFKNQTFPVILFSHGLGGSREAGQQWGEFWASHGYIVIHLQHPGSDENTHALSEAASRTQLLARIADLKFVLDKLATYDILQSADTQRIGMSGHSFGALSTQVLAGQKFDARSTGLSDPRIKAAIAFSPSVRNRVDAETQFNDVTLPFMSITGTQDGKVFGLGVAPEERVRPFYAMPPGNKYLAVFNRADLLFFNGRNQTQYKPATNDFDSAGAVNQVQNLSLKFWDAHLREKPKAQRWLKQEAATALLSYGRFESR